MLICLGIWSCGLCLIWFRTTRLFSLINEPKVPYGWRAATDLVGSLETDLAKEGIDIFGLTDRQLKKKVAKDLNGGSMMLRSPLQQDLKYKYWSAFKSWIKKERWWILAFCLSGVPIAVAVIRYDTISTMATTAFTSSLYLGGKLGHSTKSRVFLISILCITGLSIGLGIMLPKRL